MRQTKMVEWMENVEKAISRIMADKVYTSAEFKRERDNFHVWIFNHTHTNFSLPAYLQTLILYPPFHKVVLIKAYKLELGIN